jgi:ribosomal peptide maturation radical SAM protein 1
MRVLLVNMPWTPIDVPSLALGILKRSVEEKLEGVEVEVVQANLDYVDWITERYEFNLHDYVYYALGTYFLGIGDWVFSSALYDDPRWRVAEFTAGPGAAMTEDELRLNLDLHALAPEFVGWLTERLLAAEPDVVGFTSTYQQNVAALAVARAIKLAAPRVRTVFGGANCDGPQGAAVHRLFPFLDFAVRGEGEASFPLLLDALRTGGDVAGIPGVCWRDPAGAQRLNPMATHPLPPAQIVGPNYTGYFERLEGSAAQSWVDPKLVIEGARGCWWGEKHHCTFCGLNGSFMQFRSKSPGTFLAEILDLVREHQVLDMYVVDNILDMGYLTSLLPMIADTGYDLRLQYEIKSNMRRHQLETLARAGVVSVQPGIESLSSRVLKLMDKGVTGCQNVRMLRDAAACGLSVSWNYLYGFPGEEIADYTGLIEQFPALHHLEPGDGATRIAVERFSPHFNRPELGFAELRPHDQYALIYDLPAAELTDLAYLFRAPARGITETTADLLRAGLAEWIEEFPRSRLSYCDTGDEVVLMNQRKHFPWTVLRLTDPLELAAFRLLDQPHGQAGLLRKLAEQVPGVTADDVAALLGRWRRLGLVFAEGGHYVHVVPQVTNHELHRVDLTQLADVQAPDAVPDAPVPVPA